VDQVTLDPRPVQQPHPPVWVGGRSRAAVRRAARYADGYLPYLTKVLHYRASIADLREQAATIGRDPDSIQAGLFIFTRVDEDERSARALAARSLGRAYAHDFDEVIDEYTATGTVERCVARCLQYYEGGARYFVFAPLSSSREDRRRSVGRIAFELIPALRAVVRRRRQGV
jgi:alkanesulfonate monooxygenase SsuD/methylene tetrahydromethanopterin reductase-like flavin-dependent oxidoreductase (luciferase family)